MNTDSGTPDFQKTDGLVPVVVQDAESQQVLMLAWMNQDAWEATVRSREAVYWSRSRKRLWKKGETSGNVQKVKEIFLDCDNDTVLLKISMNGQPACHTGRPNCFYKKITGGSVQIISEPLFDPSEVYGKSSD